MWGIVARPELRKRAIESWACAYATYRCAGASNEPLNRDGMQTQALRIQMAQGNYLLFDAQQVPFIDDEGIPLDVLGLNHYKSDMYFIPLAWRGQPLTYIEHFDMGNSWASEWADFLGNDTRVINNGLYRVAKRTTGFCLEYLFAAKLRLILEPPFLAGRLDDIRFKFYAKTRAADPGVTAFYADGGMTYRS